MVRQWPGEVGGGKERCVGSIWVTIDQLRVTMGHLRLTIGYLRVTTG